MKPIIALIGRPNVGKSTLFNRLTRSRGALVADEPGVTRDRHYGHGRIGDRPYLVIDTGGMEVADGRSSGDSVRQAVAVQTARAVAEADVLLLIVDGRAGISSTDREIADALRRSQKRVHLVVNKCEGMEPAMATAEASELGLGLPHAISASHGDGIADLMEEVLSELPVTVEESPVADVPVIAVVGRPNVGKSTLINAILGEDRVVVSADAGTTRDSIDIPFERRGRSYVLVDTAGVRRRGRIERGVEHFSVIKTMEAIERANVVLFVVDAKAGVAAQDAALAGYVVEQGRGVVVVLNKWDAVANSERSEVMRTYDRMLGFLDFARLHQISALTGTGVGGLFTSIDECFASAHRDLPTPKLTKVLQQAVTATPPPVVGAQRPRPKYAHQGGKNPPRIVIHGNKVAKLREGYRRYLANFFRKAMKLQGTPIRIECREGTNPYADKKRVRRKAKKKR